MNNQRNFFGFLRFRLCKTLWISGGEAADNQRMHSGNTVENSQGSIVRNLLKSCELLTMLWYAEKQPQDLVALPLTSPLAGRRLSPYKQLGECEGGQ